MNTGLLVFSLARFFARRLLSRGKPDIPSNQIAHTSNMKPQIPPSINKIPNTVRSSKQTKPISPSFAKPKNPKKWYDPLDKMEIDVDTGCS